MPSRFTSKGEMPHSPPGAGKSFFIGGAAVLAGLSGFYLSMLWSKRRQERDGTNPTYERVLAHVKTKPIGIGNESSLPNMTSEWRERSGWPTAPIKEHKAKHITIEEHKASPEYSELSRYQVPVPQRARGDGSGRVYTKSPDYVRNYEKTNNRTIKGPAEKDV